MGEWLHAGALLPAAVGACCTVGAGRSRRAAAGVAAAVMLAAMLDVTTRFLGLPAFLWAVVLLATALATAFATRLAPSPGDRPSPVAPGAVVNRHGTLMTVHAAIGLIVTAALLMTMGGGALSAVVSSHHGGGAANGLVILVAGGALAYIGFGIMIALRLPRVTVGQRLGVLEVVSMAAMTGLMLAAVVVR